MPGHHLSLPFDVVIPVGHLHVMRPVDLEHEDSAIRQVPLAVEEPLATTPVPAHSLSTRNPEAETPAHTCDVDLAQGLRATPDVVQRQPHDLPVPDLPHLIESLVGPSNPLYFRYPYGAGTDAKEAILRANGYAHGGIGWDIDTLDWCFAAGRCNRAPGYESDFIGWVASGPFSARE